MTVLLVAAGAAVGAPLRYLVDRRLQARHRHLPWGTLLVNVVGSLLAVPPDEQPIIIIEADEGPYPERYNRDQGGFDWSVATDEELATARALSDLAHQLLWPMLLMLMGVAYVSVCLRRVPR